MTRQIIVRSKYSRLRSGSSCCSACSALSAARFRRSAANILVILTRGVECRSKWNGGHAGDNERCGERSVFWCVPHKGCGRGYSRSYPACNRKPRHCLSPNEGRSFALPRHAELHRAAGLFRISERGVEGESRGSRKGEDRQCAITLGAGCPCNHFSC